MNATANTKTIATADQIMALADGGLTASQIATRLNDADMTTERKAKWYTTNTLQWFDRIPDEHIAKNWPQIWAALEGKRKADAARAKRAKVEKAAVKTSAVAAEGTPTPSPVQPQVIAAPEVAKAAVVAITAQGLATIQPCAGILEATKVLLQQDPPAEVVHYAVATIDDLPGLLATHSVRRVVRLG